MQGFGTDRTLSAREWRALILAGCGVLVLGVGLGILIGRLSASPPDPPPASASILPEPDGLPDSNPTIGSAPDEAPRAAEAVPVVAPAAPPVAVAPPSPPPPPPVQQREIAPPPERVAAPVPVAADPKPRRAVRPKAPEPKPKPVPVETKPPAEGPRWIVQLGAFQSSDHANLLVNTLAAHGQPARVSFVRNAAGEGWFYVQTPPYGSVAAAKAAAQGLAAREHLPTYLIRLPAAAD